MLGYRATTINVSGAWRSVSKAYVDVYPLPWLLEDAFCPSWWPADGFHGNKQTVNAFVDGTLAQTWDELHGGSDRALLVEELDNEVYLYAYATDVYDEANTALWVDTESVTRDPRVPEVGDICRGHRQ